MTARPPDKAQPSGRLSIIPAAAVFDGRIGSADLRVLCAIAAYADRSGKCWPATTTLASELAVSDRRVRSCLRNLERCGYLKTEHRPGQRSIYVIARGGADPGRQGPRRIIARRLSRTQRDLFWGLVTDDHRLKRWKDGGWSLEFLLDGQPCGGGLSVDRRTVKALVRAGWIDRDGHPIRHDVGVQTDA